MRLAPLTDPATRDALLSGTATGYSVAPGWPHEDSHAGLSFLDNGGMVFLVIDDDERIAGDCGTKAPPDPTGMVEIGYGLAAQSRGHGLGTGAVRALVDQLATDPAVRRIEAEVHVGNEPSWRVLEHLGFSASGVVTSGFTRYVLRHLE